MTRKKGVAEVDVSISRVCALFSTFIMTIIIITAMVY